MFASNQLVSVIIPTYNQASFISACLASLVKQTYTHWEAIVIDDGSIDNTKVVMQHWTSKDNRIKYYRTAHKGVSAARNLGIQNAKGDFIQFLDSDDWIENDKLHKSLQVLFDNADTDVVITDFSIYNESTKHVELAYCDLKRVNFTYGEFLYDWGIKFSIPNNVALFRRTVIEGFGFNTAFSFNEDWLLWLHVSKKTTDIFFLNEALSVYRIHNSNVTRNLTVMAEDSKKVMQWIYEELLVSDEQKQKFFQSCNERYIEYVKNSEAKNVVLRSSFRYKIGDIIVSPFSYLRRIKWIDNYLSKKG